MLSIKALVAKLTSLPTIIFDEIDTGIGGETAICIGKALVNVASGGQVIAITHLPQIAQFAETLIVVQKDIHNQNKEARTESFVKEICGKMVGWRKLQLCL